MNVVEHWPDPMEIVEVVWVDSKAGGGWSRPEQYRQDYRRAMRCRSVGYLLQGGREDHLLIQSVSANGNVADAIVIPKVSIQEVTHIRPKGKQWPSPR